MKKLVILLFPIIMLLSGCAHITFLNSKGMQTTIEVPNEYKTIKAFNWEDNKLIIEFK